MPSDRLIDGSSEDIEMQLVQLAASNDSKVANPLGDQPIPERVRSDLAFIAWNISGTCNLRCTHCYLDAGFTVKEEPPLDVKVRVVAEAKHLGVKMIFLAGGEPFLARGFWPLLLSIRDHGIAPCVNTNGTVLSSKTAERLVDNGVCHISIGIDATTADIHDGLRGSGNLAKTVQGIRVCADHSMSVNLDYTLTALNYKTLNDVPRWAREAGCSRVTLKRFVPRGRPGVSYEKWELTREMLREALTIWAELMETETDIQLYSHDPLLLAYLHSIGRAVPPERSLRLDCNAGAYTRGWLGISPSGDVQPCPIMTEVVVGNICTHTLRECLNTVPFMRLRNIAYDPPGKCNGCPHLSVCRGGCKAYTRRVTPNYYEPDPLCWLR